MLAALSPCTVSNCSFVLVDCHMRSIQAALTCPFAIAGHNASRGEMCLAELPGIGQANNSQAIISSIGRRCRRKRSSWLLHNT